MKHLLLSSLEKDINGSFELFRANAMRVHESDTRAVMRLVTSMINKPPDSAFARCLLIRYAFSFLGSELKKELLQFVKDSIKHYKSPMVMFEAATALCHVPNIAQSDLALAVTSMLSHVEKNKKKWFEIRCYIAYFCLVSFFVILIFDFQFFG